MAAEEQEPVIGGDKGKPPTTISLRAPSKYLSDPSKPSTTASDPFGPPPNEWIWGTWAVTHSTLSMWRSAKNVRITYKPLNKSDAASGATSAAVPNDNLVEYEKKGSKRGVKSVAGIEKPDPHVPGAWNWRGKGWLAIARSHWEIMGWGERPLVGAVGDMGTGVERWVVTWFAPTLFTQEGIDIYSDRPEGLTRETLDGITKALKELKDAPKIVEQVEKKMFEVEISLPWQ